MTTFRRETVSDHARIYEVERDAFEGEAEAKLVDALRQTTAKDAWISLVAEEHGDVVGHILFSPVLIESERGGVAAMALAPMAVAPVMQRRGVGTALVRAGIEACRDEGHAIVIVVGHPDFYPRFGFMSARTFGLEAPFPVDDEAFLVLPLSPSALDGVCGMVRYPDAFSNV